MDSLEIKKIISKQNEYFTTHETFSVEHRLSYLKKLLTEIKKNQSAILDALYKDLGKSRLTAFGSELIPVYNELNYMIKNTKKLARKRYVSQTLLTFPSKNYIQPEPYGKILILSPWNYPFFLAIKPTIGAIAAGNCVILKPSELTPHTTSIVAKIIESVFPQEYFAVIQGGVEVAEALTAERFDFILYTGSTRVGKIVMEAASKNLTPVCLELGGKSPTIVLDDIDLELAAKRIIFGKFFNVGQTCIAPDYVLAHKNIKNELIIKLKETVQKFIGEDFITNPEYSHIITEQAFERLIKIGEEYNIKYDKDSLKIGMTIVDEPALDSPLMQEEIFGPLLPVLSVESYEEAIRFVQEREKPLNAYLFTESKVVQEHFSKHVSAGNIVINDTILNLINGNLPFGGVGFSGMGKYQHKASFDIFSHLKSVMIRSKYLDFSFRYPPFPKILSKFLK